MYRLRKVGILVSIAVLSCLLIPGAALGAPPTIERVEIDGVNDELSEFLTEECGVPVTVAEEGHFIIRSFDRATGVTEVFTVNLGLTATSASGVYRFRDVGADATRVLPDGTLVVSIIGQLPFDFTGIVKLDGEGNVILESNGDRGEKQLAAACAALNP